jgi:ATP-dependent RNA helicase SUPV3L1/SUV3
MYRMHRVCHRSALRALIRSKKISHIGFNSRLVSEAPQVAVKELSNKPRINLERNDKISSNVENDKDIKEHQKRLRIASQSVSRWLGRDPECFDWTMKSLSLQSTSNQEYQNLYIDSLSSFYTFIQRVIFSGETNKAEDSTDGLAQQQISRIQKNLEELIALGFGDVKFSEKFHYMSKKSRPQNLLKRKIESKKLQLDALSSEMEEKRKIIAAIQEEMRSQDDEISNNSVTSVFTNLFRSFQEITFNGLHGKNDKEEKDKSEDDQDTNSTIFSAMTPRQQLERKILKYQRQLKWAKSDYDNARQELDELNLKLSRFAHDIDPNEYNRILSIVKTIMKDMCQDLATHLLHRHKRTIEQYQILDSKTDLTKPHEWFHYARLDRRKIIFHGGPTNSGKTYNALQRLKSSERGLYVGPLRLLVAEIYELLTSQGVYTNLFTGQEKRIVPFATHMVATVELAPIDRVFDVVVIDEIQMLSDPERGYAWTRALLGLRSKEVHVCGGMEAFNLVQKLAADCGDEFVLHEYQRFSPLRTLTSALSSSPSQVGSYKNVQPGDCVVAFSRADIFAIKREIEKETQYKCCVIYGTLPPKIRSHQARLFNNPNSGYDILVASDAIGMGLNLSIRRIIFNSIFKTDSHGIVRIDHSSLKQIAGRAGRRNSLFPEGEVTCRDPRDLEYLTECLSTDIPSLRKAGLLPSASHVEVFADALQQCEAHKDKDNLNKILSHFSSMAKIKGDYFLCRQEMIMVISRMLNDLDLNMSDKYLICMAPVNPRDKKAMKLLYNFARKRALGQFSGLNSHANATILKIPGTFEDLNNLCELNASLALFLWLHYRFSGSAIEEQAALSLTERSTLLINEGLQNAESLKSKHCYLKRDKFLRDKMASQEMEKAEDLLELLEKVG